MNVFEGAEFVSDSYPQQIIFNDACLEVQSKMVSKNDNVQIASDDVSDGETETVNNVIDAHKLTEVNLSKKEFMAVVKAYLKRVVEHLKANGKEERVKGFQQGATEMIKFVVGKFDEMQFFMDENMNIENGLCFSYNKDGEIESTFMFFLDGLREEKF